MIRKSADRFFYTLSTLNGNNNRVCLNSSRFVIGKLIVRKLGCTRSNSLISSMVRTRYMEISDLNDRRSQLVCEATTDKLKSFAVDDLVSKSICFTADSPQLSIARALCPCQGCLAINRLS